jgi:hypothetical protein
LAGALKLMTYAPLQGSGAGAGTYAMAFARAPIVLDFPDGTRDTCARPAVVDLSKVKTPNGAPLGVILGQDFLDHRVMTVDYDAGVLTIHPRTWAPPTTATRVPLARKGALRYVEVVVTANGARSSHEQLLLDSGSEDAVDDSLVMVDPSRRGTTTGIGLGHPYAGWFGHLREVAFGGVVFHDVPSVWPGRALVGGGVLRRFRVTLDEPHDAIWLEPGHHLHDSF